MPVRVALICVCLAAAAPALRAQSGPVMAINPDRPDLTNSPQLVEPGIVQIESGVAWTRQGPGHHDFGSPIVVRIGVSDGFEAQVGTDGLLTQTEMGERAVGVGDVWLGAKIRLLSDSNSLGRVSLLPLVSLPAASGERQLLSGDPDYTLTFMTGADLGSRAHIDTNYTLGAIGGGGGRGHFVQHVVSGSMSLALTGQSSGFFEGFWMSRQEPGGPAMTAIDTGVIYAIGARMAVDGGIAAGVSGDAPAFSAFGGFSVALGHARARSAGAHARGRFHSPASASLTSTSTPQGRGSDPRR